MKVMPRKRMGGKIKGLTLFEEIRQMWGNMKAQQEYPVTIKVEVKLPNQNIPRTKIMLHGKNSKQKSPIKLSAVVTNSVTNVMLCEQ